MKKILAFVLVVLIVISTGLISACKKEEKKVYSDSYDYRTDISTLAVWNTTKRK